MENDRKIIHLMYVPATGLGNPGYRGDAWLSRRIEIFKRFTLPALLNQSKKEFIIWISWRPEEKENPQVKELKKTLDGLQGISTVFTFNGLCFIDDKFSEYEAKAKLIRNLKATLPELEPFVRDSEWVYLTIQPSDDCYAYDAVATIQDQEPGEKALGYTRGYIMDYSTKETLEYDPDTLPPFSTIVFPTKTFLDPWKHLCYTGPYKSHEYVRDVLPFTELPGRGFLVGTHGSNISTTFNHPYAKNKPTDQQGIWIRFGLLSSDPVKYHKGAHLWLRIIVNALPHSWHPLLKRFYYHVLRT